MNDFGNVIGLNQPLTDDQLHKIYVSGVMRNLQSVLAGLYSDAALSKSNNHTRGEYSYEILVHIFTKSKIGNVCRRLLTAMKSSKQGKVSYHDLALAHCLLCVLQFAADGKHDRHSIVFASSPYLGNSIAGLRRLTINIFKQYSFAEFRKLKPAHIEANFPEEFKQLAASIDQACEINSKGKSKPYPKSITNIPRLIGAFALLRSAGLDDRPFDQFLEI